MNSARKSAYAASPRRAYWPQPTHLKRRPHLADRCLTPSLSHARLRTRGFSRRGPLPRTSAVARTIVLLPLSTKPKTNILRRLRRSPRIRSDDLTTDGPQRLSGPVGGTPDRMGWEDTEGLQHRASERPALPGCRARKRSRQNLLKCNVRASLQRRGGAGHGGETAHSRASNDQTGVDVRAWDKRSF